MTQTTMPEEFNGRIRKTKDWREIVAWVGDLEPMPQVATRALNLIEKSSTTSETFAKLLYSDAALAARVLKISNSAMFCRQREITTLEMAVNVIGFKALKGIIVAATMKSLFPKEAPLDQLVWDHSTGTAAAATVVARMLNKKYHEEAFLLGLLHSLGHFVFLSRAVLKKDFEGVIELIKTDNVDYITAEHETLGFAHPLVGALVAKKWNFPAETCQTILHYKDPPGELNPNHVQDEKAILLQLSDLIAHLAGIGSPEGYPVDDDDFTLLARKLGVEDGKLEEFRKSAVLRTKAQFQEDKQAYSK